MVYSDERSRLQEQVRGMSLRFESPIREQAFVQARSLVLRRNAVMMSTLAITVLALHTCIEFVSPADLHQQVATFRRGVVILSVLHFSTAYLLHPRWEHCMSARVVEYSCSCGLFFLIVWCFLAEPMFICHMLGLGDSKEHPHPKENGPYILANVVVVSGAHSGLPVRWYLLLVFDIYAFLFISVVTLSELTPASHHSPGMCVSIFFLYASILWAKRQSEVFERMSFSRILDEKSLRVQCEYRLAQAEDKPKSPARPVDNASASKSLPETTLTGQLFKDLAQSAPVSPESMRHILELGHSEKWLIMETELEIFTGHGAFIGQGGFATVFFGKYQGSSVAVKVPVEQRAGPSNRIQDVANELRILRKLRHAHLVQLYGACLNATSADIVLVLELVVGETLTTFVSGAGSPSPTAVHRLEALTGLALALVYLHSREPCIVHSDFKPPNIMVQKLWHPAKGRYVVHPKLLDFGLARICTLRAQIGGSTVRWAAPEMIISSTPLVPLASVDVFSFGRVIFYVSTGCVPYDSCDEKQVRAATIKGPPLPKLPWPQTSSDEITFSEIAEPCLQYEPEVRPSMRAVHNKLRTALLALDRTGNVPSCAGKPPQDDEGTHDDPQNFWVKLEMMRKSGAPPAVPEQAPMQPDSRVHCSGRPDAVPSASNKRTTRRGVAREVQPPGSAALRARGARGTDAAPTAAGPGPGPTRSPEEPASRSQGALVIEERDLSKLMSEENSESPLRGLRSHPQAVVHTLVDCILRWQFDSTLNDCCSLHSAVRVAATLLEWMAESSCRESNSRTWERQCSHCFIHASSHQRECEVCRGALDLRQGDTHVNVKVPRKQSL